MCNVTSLIFLSSFRFDWTKDRTDAAFRHLMQEGIAWVDDLDPCGERVFWFPSLMGSIITS